MGQLTSLLSKPVTILGAVLLVVLTVFAIFSASAIHPLGGISAGMILLVMFVLTWFLVPPLRTTNSAAQTEKAQNAFGLMLLEVSAFYAGASPHELLSSGLLPAAVVITLMTVVVVLRYRRGAAPFDHDVAGTASSAPVETPEE